MRTVLYTLLYFYDAADEAWPVAYLNDLPCSFNVIDARTRADSTPIDGDVAVTGSDGVHDFLMDQSDVTVLQDPYED